MTQTLTEQGENGTLPDGYYWCLKLPRYGEPRIEMVGISNSYLPSHYEEILAPVPTFEEWQAMGKRVEELVENSKNMNELNQTILNRCAMLQTQLKIARKALAFYAERNHYCTTTNECQTCETSYTEYDIFDFGETASNALAQMDELKGGE